jgi:hypothetical protein
MYQRTSVLVIIEILDAHRPPGGRLGAGHTGLFETITNSLCNGV